MGIEKLLWTLTAQEILFPWTLPEESIRKWAIITSRLWPRDLWSEKPSFNKDKTWKEEVIVYNVYILWHHNFKMGRRRYIKNIF